MEENACAGDLTATEKLAEDVVVHVAAAALLLPLVMLLQPFLAATVERLALVGIRENVIRCVSPNRSPQHPSARDSLGPPD
jgi:hypothetical protein